MPDDKKNRGPGDSQRVNVNEDYELRYWTESLGVTAQKLKDTVSQVGPMVKDVVQALGK